MMTSIPLPPEVTTTPGRLGGVPVVTVETPGGDPCSHNGPLSPPEVRSRVAGIRGGRSA